MFLAFHVSARYLYIVHLYNVSRYIYSCMVILDAKAVHHIFTIFANVLYEGVSVLLSTSSSSVHLLDTDL